MNDRIDANMLYVSVCMLQLLWFPQQKHGFRQALLALPIFIFLYLPIYIYIYYRRALIRLDLTLE